MEISPEAITDLSTRRYLGCDDIYRSLDDLLSWMEGEEDFLYSEDPIQFDHICHDLPSFFYGEHGFGFFLQSVWCIDILDFLQSLRIL